jgi:hypothetical protein
MAETGWKGMRKSYQLPVASNQKINWGFFVWLLVAGYWLLCAPSAYACPTCNDLLNRGKDAFAQMRFSQGIAWTILMLFAVPFSMAGTFIFIIWRASRRKKESERLIP